MGGIIAQLALFTKSGDYPNDSQSRTQKTQQHRDPELVGILDDGPQFVHRCAIDRLHFGLVYGGSIRIIRLVRHDSASSMEETGSSGPNTTFEKGV